MYYRGTSTPNPMSAWGHAMFVDNFDSSYARFGCVWSYNGEAGININDLKADIASIWDEMVSDYDGRIPADYAELTGDEIAALCDPEDIVEVAGIYDNDELFQWFCEAVVMAKGIRAIITQDGAIVFDRDLIKREADWGKE